MTFSNYTLSDTAESLVAIVAFFPVLFVPGYVMGWLTTCFDFRQLAPRWRAVLSIPLSMAVCPATIYWCNSFGGWLSVSVLFLALFVLWLWLLAGKAGHERWNIWLQDIAGIPKGILLAAFVWLLIVMASLVDIQIGNRLYFSSTAFDHSVRTAFTESIARVGAHPNNPFYYLTGPAPLRYHYFWLLPCGFLSHVLGELASARTCIYASAVWCGWGFMAIIPAAFRFLLGFNGAELRRRSYLAVAFTAVTGLDILPTLYLYRKGVVLPDMEWWNENQITSLWGSAVWVPHHFAALVIGVVGFLISWDGRSATTTRKLISCALLAGIAYGSLIGTSVYVTVIFALFLSLFTVITLFKRETKQFISLAIAGCVATVVAVPYLHTLAGQGEGGPFMRPSVRHFWPVDHFVAHHSLSLLATIAVRLIGLPVCYLLELGFFFFVGLVFLWKLRAKRNVSPALKATVLLLGTSVFIATFFRSGVIANNDLGARGFLPAQFVLLLWAADLFSPSASQASQAGRGTRPILWKLGWALLLIIGIGGTFYQAGMLRMHGMLADQGLVPPFYAPDRQLGERTYALRKAYDAAKIRLGTGSVIQLNPKWNYYDLELGLYSDQQTAAYDSVCGAQFGGDPSACAKELPVLTDLFANGNAFDLKRVTELCNSLHIKALVIKDKDGIKDREPDWLRSLPVIADNPHVRIVQIPTEPVASARQNVLFTAK